jgi:hypothetical protein
MNLKEILDLKYPLETSSGLIRCNNRTGLDDGWEIGTWNVPFPQPTQQELAQWAIELIPIKYEIDQRQNRREEYPAFGDQLDAILKYLEKKKADGEDLIPDPDLDSIINDWRAVKIKYPLEQN